MKKLIGLFFCFISVVSISAKEWKSIFSDNTVYDIHALSDNEAYVATNGGIRVLNNDSSWGMYTTVDNSLPGNCVLSVAARSDGCIFASGHSWVSFKPKGSSYWPEYTIMKLPENLMGYDLAINLSGAWAALNDGLYINTQEQWIKTSFSCIPYKVASVGGIIWGTCNEGIFSYFGTDERIWKIGDELIAGAPLNIGFSGDTILFSGMNGIYEFIGGELSRVIAYPPNIPSNNELVVTVFQGKYFVGKGYVDGISLYSWDPQNDWQIYVFDQSSGYTGGGINCFASRIRKLFIGSCEGKMWVFDGLNFKQKAMSNIHFPHCNSIYHIAPDNSGRILVAGGNGSEGGYRYDVGENSPSLNSSVMNLYGQIRNSFIDNEGAQWIGYYDRLERNGYVIPANGLEGPYWLFGGPANHLWMVTFDTEKILSYAGDSTWADQMNTPSGFTEGAIASVSSNGKRVWIATDSVLYSYDFKGNWTYKQLGYSTIRCLAADDLEEDACWIGDGGYNGKNEYFVKCLNSSSNYPVWPYLKRVPISLFVDHNSCVWVATDSGAYFLDRKNDSTKWQAVPLRQSSFNLHTLADDRVHVVYVDSLNDVWFGTCGGLTVWHRDNVTKIEKKTGFNNKSNEIFFSSKKLSLSLNESGKISVKLYTLTGRRVTTLFNGYKQTGKHSFLLRNLNVSSGNYICVLQTKNLRQTKKIIINQ